VILGVAVLTVLATGLDIVGVSDFRQKMVTGVVLLGAVLVSRARALRPEQVRRTLELARGRVAGPEHVAGRRPAS
jgi:ribose/xylose/arabinose/galactoside ABC-type transport system permease subunit